MPLDIDFHQADFRRIEAVLVNKTVQGLTGNIKRGNRHGMMICIECSPAEVSIVGNIDGRGSRLVGERKIDRLYIRRPCQFQVRRQNSMGDFIRLEGEHAIEMALQENRIDADIGAYIYENGILRIVLPFNEIENTIELCMFKTACREKPDADHIVQRNRDVTQAPRSRRASAHSCSDPVQEAIYNQVAKSSVCRFHK
jgi:hypothetical protein